MPRSGANKRYDQYENEIHPPGVVAIAEEMAYPLGFIRPGVEVQILPQRPRFDAGWSSGSLLGSYPRGRGFESLSRHQFIRD